MKITIAVVAAALVAALAPAGASAASVERDVTQSASSVRDYWNAHRMENATPGEALLDGLFPGVGVPDLSGATGATASKRAQPVSNASAKGNRTHGKVFFTLGGLDYVCSGTAIKSKTKSLVVSAGHCAWGDGQFATNWMFVPAYSNGSEPYGEFAAKRLAVTKGWHKSEDIRYDVSMATVGTVKGKRLEKRVGARGVAFSKSRHQHFTVHGYPAAPPYDGETQYTCNSRFKRSDNPEGKGKPKTMGVTCDQTGGSSGGGWVIKGGLVNSVVSYGYECGGVIPVPVPIPCDNPREGELYGPYFGKVIKKFYLRQQAKR